MSMRRVRSVGQAEAFSRASAACGFTLVEVVIALSLVSLVMLGLIGAMRTFGDSATRLEARSLTMDELRIVPPFLDRILSRAVLRGVMTANATEPVGMFRGDGSSAQWLGVMPGRHGVGGLSHMRLALEELHGERALALRVQPFIGDDVVPDWAKAEPEAVINRIQSLRLRYLPAEGGEWLETWDDPNSLPGWVSLEAVTGAGPWPMMVFRLLTTGVQS